MVFPSDSWLEAATRAASSVAVDSGAELTLRQVVVQADGSTRAYRIVLGGGRAVVEPGEGPAMVTLTTDEATAAAVAAGEMSVEAAFTAGKVRIGGDAARLVGAQGPLAALAAALRSVPGQTSNEPPERQ